MGDAVGLGYPIVSIDLGNGKRDFKVVFDKIFFLNQGNRKELSLIILLSCWHMKVLPEYNRVWI